MNKEEAYRDGWHEGRRMAESDIRNHVPLSKGDALRKYVVRMPEARAWHLGLIRGYRDTAARYDAGEYTGEMFDTSPLGT